MNYITVREVALKWKIKERRVRALLLEGRIIGAKQENGHWLIPSIAEKPLDRRVNKKESSVKLALNDEEYGDGFYSGFGGCFLPARFKAIIEPILITYRNMFNSSSFISKLNDFRKKMQFRPTPIYFAEKFSKYLGSAAIYIKREDLNFTNSLYINQTLPMAFLAKELNKNKMLAEAGDANYAVSLAFAAKQIGIGLELYVGYQDYMKQKSTFDQVSIMGYDLVLVTDGNQNLYDATNSCFRRFLLNEEEYFYCFHDCTGPHPFPIMNEYSESVISNEVVLQFHELLEKNPNYVVAPMLIASNANAIFQPYLNADVKLIAVENTNSIIKNGKLGRIHGSYTMSLVDEFTGKTGFNLECSGMNYPVINPKLYSLISNNVVEAECVSDEEAANAVLLFSSLEGIIPSFEDGYSLAYIIKLAQKIKSGTILMCMTGSGTKDVQYINEHYQK